MKASSHTLEATCGVTTRPFLVPFSSAGVLGYSFCPLSNIGSEGTISVPFSSSLTGALTVLERISAVK